MIDLNSLKNGAFVLLNGKFKREVLRNLKTVVAVDDGKGGFIHIRKNTGYDSGRVHFLSNHTNKSFYHIKSDRFSVRNGSGRMQHVTVKFSENDLGEKEIEISKESDRGGDALLYRGEVTNSDYGLDACTLYEKFIGA